jgi:cell wall assembly regulator SMI1
MIQFKEKSNPIQPSEIIEVENYIGAKFPESMREVYSVQNGGRPANRFYKGSFATYVLHKLLPMKRAAIGMTLEQHFDAVRRDKSLLPDFLVPFGIDLGGDYFCIDTRGNHDGPIYIFHMDQAPNIERAMEFVSLSFSEFINGLTSTC